MKFRKLFFGGKACDKMSGDMDALIGKLLEERHYLHGLKASEIIGFLDKVGSEWKTDAKVRKAAGQSAKYLSDLLTNGNLNLMLDTALRKKEALDGFVPLSSGKSYYHAQPRGLVVHWIAGNVPILGFVSVLQALLTKNVSLVKASSKSYEPFIAFLSSLAKVNMRSIRGSEISKSIAVVLVEREDLENQERMSLSADVRVVWGGREAVEFIQKLPRKMGAEDIIYGPKYSFAVIGREFLKEKMRDAAYRLAIDASVFDQYSCSSPHTAFVEGGREEALGFARELARQMDFVNKKLIPKGETDPGKSMDILKLRSRYEFTGDVFSSKNSDWTVIFSEEEGLAEACFSRVVFVRPLKDIKKVAEYAGRKIQTMGVMLPEKRRRGFLKEATMKGIDRCPELGRMSSFESPWDGMFALDRMVRWVTTY
jgi:hypothetical protein